MKSALSSKFSSAARAVSAIGKSRRKRGSFIAALRIQG
jgi:hypothetical protein